MQRSDMMTDLENAKGLQPNRQSAAVALGDLTMAYVATFQADGFCALFNIDILEDTTKFLDLSVDFLLDPQIESMKFSSKKSKIQVNDLEELESYFIQHLHQLQEDSEAHSRAFTPLELGFQITAFSGELRSPDDGEFTVQLLLNFGTHTREGTNVYIGGEAVVTLYSIKRFLSELNVIISGIKEA